MPPILTDENLELEKILRHLERRQRNDPPLDGPESRPWSGALLWEYARICPKSRHLEPLLEGVAYEIGGDEHHLYLTHLEDERLYKTTYGDNLGCCSYFSAHDPELVGRHFHGTTNADPVFYLRRWYLLNKLSEYQTRFEGILPPEKPGWLPRICVSQPRLSIENPTLEAIRSALWRQDFRPVSDDAFIHLPTGILLTDAAPRNVRILDHIAIPFDAIAQIPSVAIRHWIEKQFGWVLPEANP